LTIQNNSSVSVEVIGLSGGPQTLEAGERHREPGESRALSLQAKGEGLSESGEIPPTPPGGESLWIIGDDACHVLGDYSAYYENPVDEPASIRVVQILGRDTQVWTSTGAVSAGPGQRLPRTMRQDSVQALVRVPCDVTHSAEVARGWLEMTLEDVHPSRTPKSQ